MHESFIKTGAYFIQNTVDPMLDKVSDILWLLQSKGINITKENIKEILIQGMKYHFISIFWQGMIHLIVAAMVCFTAYKICVMSL